MPRVLTILELPGCNREQYEATAAHVNLSGAPEGIQLHSCGPISEGWRVVDVWDSREEWERFLEEHFLPAWRAVGGSEPARREVMETYHAGPVLRESR